jgi:hypothetical protein
MIYWPMSPAGWELFRTEFRLGRRLHCNPDRDEHSGRYRYFLNFMSAGLNVVTMSCIIPFLVT